MPVHYPPDGRDADDGEADTRAAAALALLSGEDAAVVAARVGVDATSVRRWADTVVHAGTRALEGRGPAQTVQARDRFLAQIAHELRTPLTVVRGWLDLLLEPGSLSPAEHDAALRTIQTQVSHLERLAEDALDSAALALGRATLDACPTDLAALATDVVAARRDARVHVARSGPVEAVVDAQRIAQVLGNLLDNAARHGDGGRVDVGVRRDKHEAEIAVTSYGRPVPPDLADRLFEPFARGADSPGTGLGLYVCRALVVAHGGTVAVRAGAQATTFFVRLPTPAGTPSGEGP